MAFIFSFTHTCSFQEMLHDGFQRFKVSVQFPDFTHNVFLQLFQGFMFVDIHLLF